MEKELSVLIVDDSKSSLLLLNEMFQQLLPKSNIHCLQCGKKALADLDHRKVDILVTDLIMPDISGYELLTKAKQINGDTLGILVTGGSPELASMEALLDCAHASGANYCIRKTHFIPDFALIKDEIRGML